MKQQLSILVVEDNVMMQETLTELLTQDGHRVCVVDCADALGELVVDHFELVILDVNLPGENGFSIAQRLRQSFPCLGIIMLTACSLPEDSIAGYLHGADNYFTKPFQPQALLIAIQALGRRVLIGKRVDPTTQSLQLNVLRKALSFNETVVSLTTLETLVLRNLALAPNKTLEEWQVQTLMENETAEDISRHYIQVFMSRLRKKLESLSDQGQTLKNVRGIGYRLLIDVILS